MNSSNVESSTCSTQEPSMASYRGGYGVPPHNYTRQKMHCANGDEQEEGDGTAQRVTENYRMPAPRGSSSGAVGLMHSASFAHRKADGPPQSQPSAAAIRRTPNTHNETQASTQRYDYYSNHRDSSMSREQTQSSQATKTGAGMIMLPVAASTSGEEVSSTSAAAAAVVLLDIVLPVHHVSEDRDQGVRPLGLCVRTGRGGANNTARLILVRLTDPNDPFFLFELELREEDYAAFKQRLELLVDFHGFPYYLVNMLQDIVHQSSPLHVSFAVQSPRDGGASATLRIVETTEFRTVEHIALVLLRQGDIGQKRYLAERFQAYEASYRRACEELDTLRRRTSAEAQAMQGNYEALQEKHRGLQAQLAVMKAEAEKAHLTSVTQMQESSQAQLSALRASYDEQLKHTNEEARALQKRLLDQVHDKEAALQELRGKYDEREAELLALRSSYRLSQDTVAAQDAELRRLRESTAELTNFKLEATKAMSENELNYVALSERLRAATASLQSKDDELQSLHAHYEKQDGYIHILSGQNAQLREQGEKAEKDLEKAHHIIAHQLQTIRNAKERHRLALDQLRSQDTLLQERQETLQRTKAELASCNDRLQGMQRKHGELKEQLEKNDAVREQLARELEQTQAALLHMQKSTSLHGRHWAAAASTFFASSPAATTGTVSGLRGGGGATSSSSYAGLTSTSPSLARTGTNANTNTQGESHAATGAAASVPRQEQAQRQLFSAAELRGASLAARSSEPRKLPTVAAPSQGITSCVGNEKSATIGATRGLLSGQAAMAAAVPASSYF